LIAIAALYLALAFHKKTRDHVFTHGSSFVSSLTSSVSHMLNQIIGGAQRQQRSGKNKDTNTFKKEEDPINFLAGMNVSIPLVVSIVQDLIGLYALWSKVKDDQSAESAHASSSGSRKKDKARDLRDAAANAGAEEEITTLSLTNLVLRMRERRDQDMSHPASGRPVAINKVLERAQASS
jgi:cyclin-C